ncbi:bacillithiol transferase BstA [Cytophagales bacterium LB-30]|uniref:Bacillithiol transferase BstA n=1 Tax=Shiella aurantiaca TaxID=3058365 RepID=A0ABT8F5M5_9BACT|nr:bacillithiol transferase BstA [Shiella aurantiaca]MDN4165750.1 bacillithiol transferase BstA [Shiella aurantiaca]
MDLELLKYPIGKAQVAARPDSESVKRYLQEIETLPARLKALVDKLNEEQLETPYRPGGWTVRQTVHHLADSHMNAYLRVKWALTEEAPTIKTYDEKAWAELPDANQMSVKLSLELLQNLHQRWVYTLARLDDNQLDRTFIHPVSGATTLAKTIGLYAWHGNHHLAHIQNLIIREAW